MHKIDRLHLNITNACNLKCAYCFVTQRRSGNAPDFLRIDTIKRIIGSARHVGVRRFSISGGEPLTHPHFRQIIEACGSDARVTLFTNLVKYDTQMFDDLLRQGRIKHLIVSLDGLDTHARLRPPSHAESIIAAIQRCMEIAPQLKVTINTVLTTLNLAELDALADRLAQLGVNTWRLDLPMKSLSSELYPTFEEVARATARLITKRYTNASFAKIELLAFRAYKSPLEEISLEDAINASYEDSHPCAYNDGQITINADGRATLCTPLTINMCDVAEMDFSEIADSVSKHPFFRIKQSDVDHCTKCRYYGLCAGGCRADALEWTGSYINPDPVACSLMPAVEKHVLPALSDKLRRVYSALINSTGEQPKYSFVSQKEMIQVHPNQKGGKPC